MSDRLEDYDKRGNSLIKSILKIQKIALKEGANLSRADTSLKIAVSPVKLALVAANIIEASLNGLENAAFDLIANDQKSQL